jgi:hypothetical protein
MKKLCNFLYATAYTLSTLHTDLYAQSNPGFVPNQLLTAAELNNAFAAKLNYSNYTPCNPANCILTGELTLAASTLAGAALNLPAGATPVSPNSGDIWAAGTGLFFYNGNLNSIGFTSGPLINGHCVSIDSLSQLVDAGGACTTGSGGGTVATGTAGQIAYYASTGNTVVGETVFGDLSIAGAGQATITANAVTNAKLAQMSADTVKCNNGTTTANPTDCTSISVASLLITPSVAEVTGQQTGTGVGGLLFLQVSDGLGSLHTVIGMDLNQHVEFGTTAPASVSSCGSGSLDSNSTDITGGATATGATACTVNFASSYSSAPNCIVSDNTTANSLKVALATGSFTVSGLTSGDHFSWFCAGKSGF